MEYKQQFYVDSEYSLLDYAFPWKDGCREDAYVEEASFYTTSVLKKEIVDIWYDTRTHIYPVSTKRNLDIVDEKIEEISYTNIIPMGRMGIHAYVSKDTCIRMGFIMSDNWDVLLNGSPVEKKKVLKKMREKLT
jgi:UDP-galactopyranose mutase